jgi:hypothetical protein
MEYWSIGVLEFFFREILVSEGTAGIAALKS